MAENNKKGGVNPLGAAIVGAAVGAAAVVLSNKDNRDKIKKAAKKTFNEGQKKFDEAKRKLSDEAQKTKDKLNK